MLLADNWRELYSKHEQYSQEGRTLFQAYDGTHYDWSQGTVRTVVYLGNSSKHFATTAIIF